MQYATEQDKGDYHLPKLRYMPTRVNIPVAGSQLKQLTHRVEKQEIFIF